MSNFIKRFVKDERGVTAVEYALIAGVIAAALLATVAPMASKLGGVFTTIMNSL
jgi:pilus assembly protein Flp/PilA